MWLDALALLSLLLASADSFVAVPLGATRHVAPLAAPGPPPGSPTALGASLKVGIALTGYFNLKSPHTVKDNMTPDNAGLMPRGPPIPLTLRIKTLTERLDAQATDLDRYTMLHSILETDATLYFGTILSDVRKFLPLVYTPTVGEACVNFSKIHTHQPKGIYLSKYDKGNIANVLRNWPFADQVKVICVTDGERILGLGDLGANGMGIPVGKLALYTALGGIEPEGTLPMHIDFGCNVDAVRDCPTYMGLRERRPDKNKPEEVAEYDAFMEEYFDAIAEVYGKDCMVQFEDFGNSNAFRFLEDFQDKHVCFNDDIQGTASVVLGGLIASLRITAAEAGGVGNLKDHTYVFLGAGEAGCGIASLIAEAIRDENPDMTSEDACSKIWLVDSKGLVTDQRDMDKLPSHKAPFAHELCFDVDGQDGPSCFTADDLEEAIKILKPSAIIGVSGQPQTFTKPIIEEMTKNHARPVIFSLSNPTSKSECTAEQAYEWSDGKAIFASGSPFGTVEFKGKKYTPAQGNNAYIFPGIGKGAIFSGATRLDSSDMICASRTLASLVPQSQLDTGACYPDLNKIRDVSVNIATDVALGQWARGTATKKATHADRNDLMKQIRNSMYHAKAKYQAVMKQYVVNDNDDAPPPAKVLKPATKVGSATPAEKDTGGEGKGNMFSRVLAKWGAMAEQERE